MPSHNFGLSLENTSNGASRDLWPTSTDPSDEICFGMLCDIQIQWTPVTSRQKLNTISTGDDEVSDIKLQFSDGRGSLIDASGNDIAVLNNKTHLALSGLASKSQIHFSGIIRGDNQKSLATNSGKPPTRGPNARSFADFLVFGVRAIADDLAKELSRHRMFLQHPLPLPSNVPYENPQYLNIAGASFSNGSLLPAIDCSDELEKGSNVSYSQEDKELQITDPAHVLDCLPRRGYLKEANIDLRISTPLLRHQKEGVDFILRRESPMAGSPHSLWKTTGLDQGLQTYHHLITGQTSDRADDTPGGILADAMGVGKTLTMIASIVSSTKGKTSLESGEEQDYSSGTTHHITVKSTLILVPSALLLDGWISEIEKHVVPGTVNYYKYHGPNRRLPPSSDFPYDVVLSTYGTVAADFRRGGGVLSNFRWRRLVLDEAHVIRSLPTKQFKAVVQLDAAIRWCMTGTPIQNGLEDLASLVRFLRVPILEDISAFRRHIIGRKKTLSGKSKPNFEKLRLLLGSICLRRSTSVLSLLGVTFTTSRPELSPEEREAYNGLALACKRSIDEAVSLENTHKPTQKHILEALLKMRIFCNLGLGMAVDGKETANQLDETLKISQQSRLVSCSYCSSYFGEIEEEASHNLTPGDDLICAECAPRQHHGLEKTLPNCPPVCDPDNDNQDEEPITAKENHRSHSATPPEEYPSKLGALLENVRQQDPQDKSIVFSSWIRSLDAVARLFTEHNITFRRIDGSLPVSQRRQILSEFYDPSVKVLLMTLGTGAVGLNQLSIASQLHLLEPQWNPSVESQAIGRVMRLNQKKQVTVIRYVTMSTIEETVESRQTLKLRLAMAGGLQSSSSDHMERIQGLKELAELIQNQLKS
ncbi:SNF2 family N-terminal domain-containing protein [Hypoxylon sp. FL1857]|nr:SNF2 family N-terminal domain-containing protein [Hypoxylon sp. FL1857]